MEASQVSFSDIAFRAFASAKGVKTSPATLRGAPVEFLLSHEEFFPCPFGASAYMQPDATRLNLEVDITNSPLLPLLQAAEQAIIQKAYADGILKEPWKTQRSNFTHPSLSVKNMPLTVCAQRLMLPVCDSVAFSSPPKKPESPFQKLNCAVLPSARIFSSRGCGSKVRSGVFHSRS